ncbi:MAG: Type 1 glutamine amidotransferase-like domain-containing protein [Candidatus Berkelbacteria bacterium]|nr:Type 1 glutamine amidotransferase-like domain-containing protein [Candidatus Berkelbacteria bacterium]
MQNLFLTSSIQTVAKDVAKRLDKSVKKFLFIITASEVETGDKEWLRLDRQGVVDAGYNVEDYSISGKTLAQIVGKLAEVDGVVMAGGNTFYLLQELQQTKSMNLFRKFVSDGKVYIGSSAGSIVAGPDIYPVRRLDKISRAPKLKGYKGLTLTDVVIFPHWGSDHFQDAYLRQRMHDNYNLDHKLVLLTDNQYLIVDGKNLQFVDVEKDE